MTVDTPEAALASRATAVRAPSHARLYGLLTLMVSFWSLNYIFTKIALRGFPPIVLATMRTTMAAAVILPIYVARGKRRRRVRWTAREVLLLAALGFFGIAMNQVFFVLGMGSTSVAHAGILIALTPVQVLLLAALVGQEHLTKRKVAGLAIALSGVAILQLTHEAVRAPSVAGDILILLCGSALAAYTVFGKEVTTRHDSVTMNTFAYVSGAILLAPVLLWNTRHFSWSAVPASAWLSVAYMAIFSSVISYIIYNYALSYVAATRVSAFSYLQPFLATLMAIPILGEHVSLPLAAGGALVLAGVWLTERG